MDVDFDLGESLPNFINMGLHLLPLQLVRERGEALDTQEEGVGTSLGKVELLIDSLLLG